MNDKQITQPVTAPRPIRVMFCWMGMTGYMAACWRELAKRPEIDLAVLSVSSRLPWGAHLSAQLPKCRVLTPEEDHNEKLIEAIVVEHQPDVVVLGGWVHRPFTRLVDVPALSNVRWMMVMDTPWQNTWRQKLARIKIGRFIDRMSCVVVIGERCFQYARHLKVSEDRILRGCVGIDYDSFDFVFDERLARHPTWPRSFFYMGRYAPEKGLDVLAEAYRGYCNLTSNPWELTCCGKGPQAGLIKSIPGVDDRGFVQPTDLPKIMVDQGAFVLPSRYDPWPLVISEACAAGLPVICTEACGSHVELVRGYYSGLIVPTDDPAAMARAMLWVSDHVNTLAEMGRRAKEFAKAYSAQAWTERWGETIRLIADNV